MAGSNLPPLLQILDGCNFMNVINSYAADCYLTDTASVVTYVNSNTVIHCGTKPIQIH